MGHTLVTRFDAHSNGILHTLMEGISANKIPFGRNCERVTANAAMDYHVTILHWAKAQDDFYLKRLENYHPIPCKLWVTGLKTMQAEENSCLLYFTVEPSAELLQIIRDLEQRTGGFCTKFYHITLAVSRDHKEICALEEHLCQKAVFPFELQVEGLDLYHIWRPTGKVRSFMPE